MEILEILQEFMVEQGFDKKLISIETKDHAYERIILHYGLWGFAVVTSNDKLFLLPFKTNETLWVNPADPNFFSVIKSALDIPQVGQPFYDKNFRGPVAQKSGARDS